MAKIIIRAAVRTDIEALYALENVCFSMDRLSKRSFRYFLHTEQNILLVAVHEESIVAYILVLLHRGTHLARVYSLAVSPQWRGHGIAERLLTQSEEQSAALGSISMRLEVRQDNESAIRLYQRLKYRPFGEYHDYYEDHTSALRLQKRIRYPTEEALQLSVPYYPQSTEFTCGPAALLMIMAGLEQNWPCSIQEELHIWREATTIYMAAGHGGCSPLGLALAAAKRGFTVDILLSSEETLFMDSVRHESKKHIIDVVHQDFKEQVVAHPLTTLHYITVTQQHLQQALEQQKIPLILISTYRFDHKKVPHWVVVVGMDEHFIYIHDPFIDEDEYRFALDNQYLPVSRENFDKMAQFGQTKLRTTLLISKEVLHDDAV